MSDSVRGKLHKQPDVLPWCVKSMRNTIGKGLGCDRQRYDIVYAYGV
jgi:hypothetical protein